MIVRTIGKRIPHLWAIKQIGDFWVESQESVILEVPSTIVPTEKYFLINPAHPNFSELKKGTPQNLNLIPGL
jgi:RES domain-containing protein